ncbi:hypothetical protein TNCV_2386781 [Trichonephila clavipes]|nr:hypothetical protein TNCV_2386781 [Trichonephila clavipes]
MPSSAYATMDSEVHEQMFRSGHPSDAKPPSVKFPKVSGSAFIPPPPLGRRDGEGAISRRTSTAAFPKVNCHVRTSCRSKTNGPKPLYDNLGLSSKDKTKEVVPYRLFLFHP